MSTENWKISFGTPANFRDKRTIAEECLEVSKAAKFPTDYEDVFDHLFGNEAYHICILYNSEDRIMGFAIFANFKEINELYLHGIVLHPLAQGKGLSKKMIEAAIKNARPKYLSARTHNPRMFETLSSFAEMKNDFYPNFCEDDIPKEITELAKKNIFTSSADEVLIVRNAYPDEKLTQSFRNENLVVIWKRLGKRDAQVIIVKLH